MAMDYYTCVSRPIHPISPTDILQWRSYVFLLHSFEIVEVDPFLDIAVAWIAQAVFDMIIFGLTVYRTLQTRRFRDGRGLLLSGSGLVDLVWRDGAMYFVVMAMSNVANIVTFYLLTDGLRGVLSTFAGW